MKTKIAVIGAGPAGLLAAWGIREAGGKPVIYDRDPAYQPGRIFSLQYLHEPCGLLNLRSMRLRYEVDGAYPSRETDAEERLILQRMYNVKLGRNPIEENSTRFLTEGPQEVWSLKDAYERLHKTFEKDLKTADLSIADIFKMTEEYAGVINTAPLDKLMPGVPWPVRTYFIRHDFTPVEKHPEDTCVYNLDPNTPWYRATRLDGGTATEYWRIPHGAVAPDKVSQFRVLRKVVSPTHGWFPTPSNFLMTGRWGSWDPKKLTHDAYKDAKYFTERLA